MSTVPAITAADRAALGLSSETPATIRAAFEPAADLASALAFTRDLTHTHYENFSVVSFLLPRKLRQDFCNVYAFCRVADDLGDEVPDRALALRYLADFRQQTQECYAGKMRTAVFVALAGPIRSGSMTSLRSRFSISSRPLSRIRPCCATKRGSRWWTTAGVRPIRWGAWCCT